MVQQINNPFVNTWHIVISGFLQDADRPHGCFRLWQRLGELRSPRTYVPLCTWDEDWKTVAAKIALTSGKYKPRVTVAAYSWGAGWGFIQLAKALQRHSIEIAHACLSDPVYRHPWFPWISLLRHLKPSIQVPNNVRKVQYFVQTKTRPTGFPVASAAITIPEPHVYSSVPHVAMDDLTDFHAAAMRIARALH